MVFLDEKIEIVLCAKGNTPLDPHGRNTAQESQGCLLVSGWVVLSAGSVTQSQACPGQVQGFAQDQNSLGALFHGDAHSMS